MDKQQTQKIKSRPAPVEKRAEDDEVIEGEVEQSFSSTISTKAGEFEDQVGELIRKRPLAVMAGALAIGFVATRFLSGKLIAGFNSAKENIQ